MGRRLCSRTNLAVSSPPFCPQIFYKADMSAPSYREEKRLEREGANQEKARMKSDKVVISGTLEESKLRAAEKAKQPQVDNGTKTVIPLGKPLLQPGGDPEPPSQRQRSREIAPLIRMARSGMQRRRGNSLKTAIALLLAHLVLESKKRLPVRAR